MKRTTTQNKQLYALIYKLSIDGESKRDMVFAFTNGRTDKSSEMNKEECQQMINVLIKRSAREKLSQNTLTNRLRRKVFTLFYELDWISSDMTSSEKMTIINDWIVTKTATDKDDLNKLTEPELRQLLVQLHAVKRNYAVKKKIAGIEKLRGVAVEVEFRFDEFRMQLN